MPLSASLGVRVRGAATVALFALAAMADPFPRSAFAQSSKPGPKASAPAPVRSALAGVVRDTAGQGVPLANVMTEDERHVTIADDTGAFRLPDLPAGPTTFWVKRIGYAPVGFTIEIPEAVVVSVAVKLTPNIARLPTVTTNAPAVDADLEARGFFERQKKGWGTFITPAEIEKRNVSRVSDYLSRVPSVTLQGRSRGPGRVILGRRGAGYCVMNVIMDGQLVRGNADDVVDAREIRAIEVYPRGGETPLEFQNFGSACGTVVIWTKNK